ncbi:LPS-assembly lipoprotein LptE [Luteimonas sp. e5]
MKRILVPALVVLLAGCGFHLRKPLALPQDIGPVRVVSSNPYSPLAENLSEALTRAGAAAPADPSATTGVARLEIISERWGDLPVSIDARGRGLEFSLHYATVFALRDGDGRDVVPRQVIELSRDYISSPSETVGTANERELLANEMRREMTAAILRRIHVATRSLQDGDAKAIDIVPDPVD